MKIYKNLACAAVTEQTARSVGKAASIIFAISSWAATAGSTTIIVAGTNQSNIIAAITSACNGSTAGTVMFPNGTYSINSAIMIPGNCTLQAVAQGEATLNANQNQIFEILSDNVTINGLIFNGGWIGFGGANSYSNFVFTNNTIQNIWSGGTSGGPVALSGPGIIGSNISNNSFLNIWGGGSPGYPNAPPSDGSSCPGQDCWGSTAMSFSGLDQTAISNNTFDRIVGDGIAVNWGSFTGYIDARSTSSNVISYNTFTHIRRIPIEIQSQPSGNCPGGCNYSPITGVTTGLQVKGNYASNYVFPFWNTWGSSLVPDGAVSPQYINNTFLANPGDANGGYAPCMESSSRNGLTQGNVCASVAGGPSYFGAGIAQGGGSNSGFTSTYQNNIFCGNPATTTFAQEGGTAYASTVVWQYNYQNGNACPAGTNLTSSNISLGFTSVDNQSFPSGGNGTWSLYVISNLSIKYVQYFLDGSTTPISTQEIQDVNANFASDQKWQYHVTINTSALTSGAHSVSALVTDVSGATQNLAENFTANGSGVVVTVPSAVINPASLSFNATTVGQTTQTQTATLINSGTAVLAIGSIAVGGSNSTDFTQSSQCGSSLAVGGSCSIQVAFNPTVAGSRAATLIVSDNTADSPQGAALTGTGNAAASDPPPPTTGSLPTNLPTGMILWLANNSGLVANGSNVSAWDDQSGNGNNAVQPNSANQPTVVQGNNGQSALRFDGATSFMSLPNLPINGSAGLTVMLVSASLTDPPAGYGWYAFLIWPETAYWGSTFFGTYQTGSYFRVGTTQVGNAPEYPMPFTRTNSFGLSEWMHAGTTDSMWFNSQSVATFTGMLQAVAGSGNSAVLGQGLNNTFYSGDIEELIVYSRSLTTAERQTIEQYLMAKYHL